MARFRRRYATKGTRRLRPVEWLAANGFDQSITTTPTVYGLSVTFSPIADLLEEYTQPTLMRMRGYLQATISGAEPSVVGHVGIIAQIPNQGTLVPQTLDPSANGELEWIYWHPIVLSTRAGNDARYQKLEIDSKAMRRLNNGEQLYLWAATAATGMSFDMAFSIRYLIKE